MITEAETAMQIHLHTDARRYNYIGTVPHVASRPRSRHWGACPVDVFADHSCAEAVMRKSAEAPHYMYVGTVFAATNSRDDARQRGNAAKDHREENMKVAKWLLNAVKLRIQNLTKEGVMVTPHWEPVTGYQDTRTVPALDAADFVVTYPSAQPHYPRLARANQPIRLPHRQRFQREVWGWERCQDSSIRCVHISFPGHFQDIFHSWSHGHQHNWTVVTTASKANLGLPQQSLEAWTARGENQSESVDLGIGCKTWGLRNMFEAYVLPDVLKETARLKGSK